jgi:hypothetical protein
LWNIYFSSNSLWNAGLEAWLLQTSIIHVLARRCHNHPAVLSPPFLIPWPFKFCII